MHCFILVNSHCHWIASKINKLLGWIKEFNPVSAVKTVKDWAHIPEEVLYLVWWNIRSFSEHIAPHLPRSQKMSAKLHMPKSCTCYKWVGWSIKVGCTNDNRSQEKSGADCPIEMTTLSVLLAVINMGVQSSGEIKLEFKAMALVVLAKYANDPEARIAVHRTFSLCLSLYLCLLMATMTTGSFHQKCWM